MKKGISLITLIITIIVIIILAGAIILSINNTNIITFANEAAFKKDVNAYISELEMYESNAMIQGLDNIDINTDENLTIDKVIVSIKKKDKNKFKVIDSELYYIPNKHENKVYVKWAKEAGCKVALEDIIPDSEWVKNDDVYCYSPSLVGFNISKARYLTFANDGKEIRANVATEVEPENWYNYSKSKKQWANIVTSNNDKEVYLVWIPRYAYKITPENTIDIVFTDVEDNYIDVNGNKLNINDNGYIKHSAFTLDFTDEGKGTKELTGIWVSKYEITEETFDFSFERIDPMHLQVTGVMGVNLQKYKFYLDNKLVSENSTGKYLFDFTGEGYEHEIRIDACDYRDVIVASKSKKISSYPANAPDISGFNKETTYYLTYDQNGNEQRVKMAGNSAPAGWYDYSKGKKQWANIVTSNNGKEVYLVWVPRYEYKVIKDKQIDIAFIPVSKTKATYGYEIPAAFTLDFSDEGKGTKELSGFWVSKYEITQ